MKLQLALDRLTREECFQIVKETKENIDWIEMGTGIIKEYGMTVVREMHELYPEKTIVADMKTCDAGGHEAIQAFEAGADITTVMGFSSDLTITDTLGVAKQYDARVMVDLLEISNRRRMHELKRIGVDLVSLHVGKDKQKEGKFDTALFSLVDDLGFEVTVAGGISEDTLSDIVQKRPNTVIVGSAITKAPSPRDAAASMKKILSNSVM
ncbi:3-hexulose-6-phosphate synthase [Lentibacillus populi]|uniref:3-hexulose-6-phosphate synthase n=1 Tax=Lentibacillus populi TaxID=1827502 RepID=A0A9W5TZ60_9BACI|nr:3-hexulose-6-phosphate synthase [Lentibacillus populi]GGB45807.1 3-hexulose-6-phosphate synthase [Lentibacillus populi]